MTKELTEADIILSGIPKSWACVDCGVNTAPGCPTAAQVAQAFKANVLNPNGAEMKFDETSEVYCVKSKIWTAAGMEDIGGCLCIGCLERRLGRRLVPKDFQRNHPFAVLPGTHRLIERRDC